MLESYDAGMTKANDEQTPEMNFKRLEQVQGFLCHLSMTYDLIIPLLKGFHLTLCGHLPSHDREG